MRIRKYHKQWLSAVKASYEGKPMSFDYLGITPKRLEVLEALGLIEYSGGKYILTAAGENALGL